MKKPTEKQNKKDVAGAKFVLLTADDAQAISRLLNLLGSDGSIESDPFKSSSGKISSKVLLQAAQTELLNRRRRADLLPKKLFGETAWEILVALYIQHSAAPVTI